MKSYNANLLADVVSVYDKTKTTIAGRVTQKTIMGRPTLGPPLTKFIDVFTDTLGTTIPGQMFLSPNGRLFVLLSAPATGVLNQIACYDFDLDTGETTYRGKIAFSIATQTTVGVRGFKVDDNDTSNIKVFLGVTSTVTISAGTLMIWKVPLSDFVPVGFPTIYTALSSDVKGVYLLQASTELGGLNQQAAVAGISLPSSSADASINTKIFTHNGVAATHQYYIFDYATAPVVDAPKTTTASTVAANPTFTMTAHGFLANDAVVITANAPTGFTLTGVSTAQTIYYVRAANLTANTFELSTTVGGVAINATSVAAGTVFVRALGMSTNNFVVKTANLPALVGTLLVTNSEDAVVPGHTANAGFDCVFFCTTSTMYLGKYTDLFSQQTGTTNATINVTDLTSTAGLTIGQTVFGTGIPAGATIATIVSPTAITLSVAATTSTTQTLSFGAALWPNLVNANVLGSGIDYVLPVPINATFSTICDTALFSVAGIFSIIKKFQNNVILGNVGIASNIYLEAQNHVTDQFSLQTIAAFEQRLGWLLASCLTIPQRGIVAMDLRSDALFSQSYIVTPVMQIPSATLKSISTIEELFDYTSSAQFQYRTAASASDTIFNSATTGWTDIATATDLSLQPNLGFVQFRILFAMVTQPSYASPSITTPTQISELVLHAQPLTEISDKWDYSQINSTSGVPTRAAFKLRTAYPLSVPTLYFRAYDESDNLVTSANTSANASSFQYSTDQGDTWTALGTIPNTPGVLVRYTWTTPPGVNVRVSIRES